MPNATNVVALSKHPKRVLEKAEETLNRDASRLHYIVGSSDPAEIEEQGRLLRRMMRAHNVMVRMRAAVLKTL